MPDIPITAADGGEFSGYLAKPAAAKAPGIVVIQEIFGVNEVMRQITDAAAQHGYVALCPDLFWRQQPGIQITDKTDAEWQRAFQLFQGFDQEKGVADLETTIAVLRAHPACTGKVGAVGFCLGGRLAYLTATRTDVDCAIGYYGVGIENLLDEAGNIRKPLMLHIAEKDKFVPPEAQDKVKSALAGNSKVAIHSYPGVDHAFARVGGEHYDKSAAELANRRSAEFFKQHLG
jgi:carboxymethylenebutenolidase